MKINIPVFNFKCLFVAISLIMLIGMIYLSKDAGISGDEYFQVDYSELVYDYFTGTNNDSEVFKAPMIYYGQSFDNIAFFIKEILKPDDFYKFRHLLNSISGFVLILFAGLIAAKLFGWRAGVICLLFIFLL